MVCHFLLQWTIFCQKSPLWPIHCGWPCIAWFIASLNYTSTFARTRMYPQMDGTPLNTVSFRMGANNMVSQVTLGGYILSLRYNDMKNPILKNTLATLCEELTHWKRPWCWEGLGAGEGDDRGWDGWMASPTRWTWVWVNSGSWWWTGWPGVLWFMGLQRIGHDWATELNWG